MSHFDDADPQPRHNHSHIRKGGKRGSRDGGGGGGGGLSRTVQISKALSRLLRHAAVEENIPIDNQGYIRVDRLLQWRRLRSMRPPVTFADVVDVVRDNEKKRFALRYDGSGSNGNGTEDTRDLAAGSKSNSETQTETEAESETQKAILVFSSPSGDTNPAHFVIRATQGHSMKSIEAENLLTPISLDHPSGIPDTVVHGTFYGAWSAILKTGGLKSMNRNHVHFATGPAVDSVRQPPQQRQQQQYHDHDDSDPARAKSSGGGAGGGGGGGGKEENLSSLLGQNKVISGMRSDAQILIYIDIRMALADGAKHGMKWWRSENGVILTDGIAVAENNSVDGPSNDGGGGGGGGGGEERVSSVAEKIVPLKYWSEVVEVKEGLGVLWRQGDGVVQELPERLSSRGVPRGKGGGYRGRGGRGAGRGRG